MLHLVARQTLDCPITDSIFIQAENLLESDGDYHSALEFVAVRKKMNNYRSIMDFLFVEIATGPWYTRCMAYYKGKSNKKASDWLTKEEIEIWDAKLVILLNVAVEWFRQRRKESWTQFRLQVK
jgi:hypothetical protein